MPTPATCTPSCCDSINTVQVPGTAGVNAYTTTTANFTVPAIAGAVSIAVSDSSWMAVGQTLFISDGVDWGHFTVTSVVNPTSISATFNGQQNDASPAAVINSGAKVAPGGTEESITLPLAIADGGTGASTQATALTAILGASSIPIANGGTSGTSKATAIAALGLGQNATADNNASLTYDVTTTPSQVTGVAAATPTTGLYFIIACLTLEYAGTTFASSRTVTISIRNNTSGSNLVTVARQTGVFTTTNQPSLDYVAFTTASLTAADSIQVFISMDVVESAGSTQVSACNLILVPLAI